MSEALLTHDQVVERTKRFQELLAREKELQTFLLKLKMHGDPSQVREQLRQHDQAIAEIRQIRQEGMVPIVKELNDFVKAVKLEDLRKIPG